jgi:abortive infection bacteriophage resistance protein
VTTIRNRCAHYSRFYDWEFADYPVFTEKALPRENTKVWGHLLVLRNMYPNEYEWNTELVPRLEDIINRYKDDIKFEHLGLPQNWNEWLIK